MIAPAGMFVLAAQDRLRNPTYLEANKDMLLSQRKSYFSECPNSTQFEYVAYATGLEVARILQESGASI